MIEQTRRDFLKTILASMAGIGLTSCRRVSVSDPFDVCVVGSGPAGAVLAAELVRRGVRTLLIEGGPLPSAYQRSPVTDIFHLESISEILPYPVENTHFLGDGGTSNLWNGNVPRFQPFDFDAKNSYVPSDAPWPVTYKELEKYFQKAEQELSVHGDESTPHSPPRGEAFPHVLDPAERARNLKHLLKGHGYLVEHVPHTRWKGRIVNVKDTHLPPFLSSGKGHFLRGAWVTRIHGGPGQRITGLEARTLDHKTITLQARSYVLACGGVETPRLLLFSRSAEFPRGIGNGSDLVGRYFMEAPWVRVGTAKLPSRLKSADSKEEGAVSWQFYRELKERGLGGAIFEFGLSPAESQLTLNAVLEMRPSASNRVVLSEKYKDCFGLPAADVVFAMSNDERKTWRHVKAIGRRVFTELHVESFEMGSGEASWCEHHMGTCRMGEDPETSVVDRNLKVHGTENLYVAGSAPFVTAGVGGPTLLLTALSLRLADHLAEKVLRRGRAGSL
jgi:choline dehydrogenase-like flavoprotein